MHLLKSRTRRGKIARLPRQIRLELNRRLDDGETGTKLLPWLNALPEVRALLAEQFEGRPITQQNLSEWRQGGWQDWQLEQSARERAALLPQEARDSLAETAEDPPLTFEALSHWLSLRYTLATRYIDSQRDSEKGFRLLRQFGHDIMKLHILDQRARTRALQDQLTTDEEN